LQQITLADKLMTKEPHAQINYLAHMQIIWMSTQKLHVAGLDRNGVRSHTHTWLISGV